MSTTLLFTGCGKSGLPEPGSKQYADLCSAFYLGLAGLQAGEDVRAKEYLTRSTQIAPGEPAGWADLGILQVRQQQFDLAFGSVEKARSLVPGESRMEALLGLIEGRRGKLPEAEAHLKKAIALDGHNLKALYSLAEESERGQGAAGQAVAQDLLARILKQQPANAAVLLDALRLAALRGDQAGARGFLGALQPLSAGWPEAGRQQFSVLERSVNGGGLRVAAVQVQFLRNVLLRVPTYREDLDQIRTPATLVAQPFTRFLRLPSPNSQPAALDASLRFDAQPVSSITGNRAFWIGDLVMADGAAPTVVWADENALHVGDGASLPLPARTSLRLNSHAVAGADLNYDFKTDLAVATGGGLRIYQQEDAQHFRDVTSASKVPASVAAAAYTGVWAFDIDLDGDLDLVLGRAQGEPVVLRNNGDGTFAVTAPLHGIDGTLGLAAADLDGDGDPDLALLDKSGNVRVFLNERLGNYRARDIPAGLSGNVAALAAGDVNGDGILDLVLLKKDGPVTRVSMKEDSADWESAELARTAVAEPPALILGDFDNNGAVDLLAGGNVFLSDGKTFTKLAGPLSGTAEAALDINSDGRLDLLAMDGNGRPFQLLNHGTKSYRWQMIRTRAAHATGDQRINSFGIGGEIEIRSELLAQKQIITSPLLHFGLGEHPAVQFARIVWPNGFVQAEFDLKADQTLLAEQRIKGSCPMLFVWNGSGMTFLKDVGPWGSALGLNVNAQGKGIYGTREWFRVSGDRMKPRDGFYDLRITAEYWETYYMDHYSLLAIDHPEGSEVYTDERFALPSPEPGFVVIGTAHPFAHATDDNGADATATVKQLDDQILDTFGRGQYQGLTRDHWLELELPDEAPKAGPLYLIGDCWIHDTDATIVKAQAQNSTAHPHGLSIEVPDAAGHWSTVRDGLGFPKGRLKTVVLDVGGIFRPGAPRRLRLRTNLELYWNRLAWAGPFNGNEQVSVRHLDLAQAELNFRGFSRITQENPSSPEVPNYGIVQESDLRWHDQEGYATRYGDVRELLTNIDDRYVITSPGDELRMKFKELPAAKPGWKRDFILICDGWVKDGDYNSTFAGTIQPLPYHEMKDYVVAPVALEADRAYQLHPQDWQTYQTRYVSPSYFSRALWSRP